MGNIFYKLIYIINIGLSMTIIGMEEQEQIPWDKLPTELKSNILKEIAQGESMEQILENLKNATRVSKEFRALAKSIAHNPAEINNIARIYIQNNPKAAYEEFYKSIDQKKADIVKSLINGGIDVNVNLKFGDTPLMEAASRDSASIVDMLIKAGADVNAKSSVGSTPLIRARYPKVINLLLEAKANIDAQNNYGYTALMFAAGLKQKKRVKLLLRRGANPNIKNNDGKTALNLATYHSQDIKEKENN